MICTEYCYVLNCCTEFDNLGKMVCFHKRYSLGDDHDIHHDDFNGWDEMGEHLTKGHDAVIILPLYLYDHSGITIQTTPFSCPWDSGQVGFIYMDRETILREAPGNPKIITKVAKYGQLNSCYLKSRYTTSTLPARYGSISSRMRTGTSIDATGGLYSEEYAKAEGVAELAYLVNKKEAAA